MEYHFKYYLVTTTKLIERFINPLFLGTNMEGKIKQQIAITKYDKPRAKCLFALFKALELFGVFLLTFGFYGLGFLLLKHFPRLYSDGLQNRCVSYLCIWVVGFSSFLCLIIALIIAGLIGYVIFLLIKDWIKANWNLAKYFTEDPKDKEKRLKQQEIANKKLDMEEKKKQRSKFGYCVGDEVEIIYSSLESAKKFVGTIGKILKIKEEGAINITNDNSYYTWEPNRFKLTKKQKLN